MQLPKGQVSLPIKEALLDRSQCEPQHYLLLACLWIREKTQAFLTCTNFNAAGIFQESSTSLYFIKNNHISHPLDLLSHSHSWFSTNDKEMILSSPYGVTDIPLVK